MIRRKLAEILRINESLSELEQIEVTPVPSHLASEKNNVALESMRRRVRQAIDDLEDKFDQARRGKKGVRKLQRICLVLSCTFIFVGIVCAAWTSGAARLIIGPGATLLGSRAIWITLRKIGEFRQEEFELAVLFGPEKVEVEACENAPCLRALAKKLRQKLAELRTATYCAQ